MAHLISALNVLCFLAVFCCAVFSQAPPAGNTDPALFLNLFQSSPQTAGAGPAAADLSSGFAPNGGVGSLPPNPMFPTLGGSPMSSSMGVPMPQATQPRPNPMSGLLRMLLYKNMDMGNMWGLMALTGMGGAGGGAGGLFSNPFMMYNLFNNM